MPNRLPELLGSALPLVQAPIGNAATPALAAAVANAGGLGMLALSWAEDEQIRRQIRAARAGTRGPVGINLVLEWPQQQRLSTVLEEGIRIVSTFWGDPGPYVAEIHRAGGVALHTAGSTEEAAAALAAGVDVLVLQGIEAGGHVRGSRPLLELLRQVRAQFPQAPVLAAGGIARSEDARPVLQAGADGVWIGTRFVCTPEANAADVYQSLLVAAGAEDTVLTTTFDRGWPNAPHRVLRNSTVRAAEAGPVRNDAEEVVARTARGAPIYRRAFALPTRTMSGNLEAMALYAGLGVGGIRSVRPAAAVVADFAAVLTAGSTETPR